MLLKIGSVIEFSYTNWKGEEGIRKALVIGIVFDHNKWHPEPQWLLKGFEEEKQSLRYFAMKDMKNVREIK